LLNMTLALSTIENYFEFGGKKGDYPYKWQVLKESLIKQYVI
jgi:hypothetical protein